MEGQENASAAEEQQIEMPYPEFVDAKIILGKGKEIVLPQLHTGETLHVVKQALADFQETAVFTSFNLTVKYVVGGDDTKNESTITDYGDFSPVSTFLNPDSKEIAFGVELVNYDLKKVKQHIDRLRDVCNRVHIPTGLKRTTPESNDNDEEKEKSGVDSSFVPKLDEVVEPVHLSKYFRTSLCMDGNKSAFNPQFEKLPLKNVIKGIQLSGWNPVPPNRKVQGDLLYLEVVLATEGTIHITATARGFYVNKSNRNTFDPSPASSPFFAHDLFVTIYGYSQSTRTAWAALCEASNAWFASTEPNALDGLIRNFVDFNLGEGQLPANSWLAPVQANASHNANAAKHSYDIYRVQQSMADLCGADELGAPREWNDEIQSIRSLNAVDLSDKIMKARLEYKIITEFTESCKKLILAIADGQISPLSYGSADESEVYSYNGIFVSRAEDIKDTFHIYEGADASRKANGRDLANQKLVRTLEIDGLGSVLCTLIDFKGIRYIGQSIIPGILAQGDSAARLMYGIIEDHKPLTVKDSTLKLMQTMAEKLFIGTRQVPQFPFGEAVSEEENSKQEETDVNDPLQKLIKSSVDTFASPIRIDQEENVPVDESNGSIAHAGPIETKIIKGTDGRSYLLELMRLTPRDANYVVEEGKGTGRLSQDQLQHVDQHIAKTYVLRQELVGIYLQRQVNVKRSELLTEAQGRQQEEREKLAAAKTGAEEKKNSNAAADEADGEKPAVEIVKEEKASTSEEQLDEEQLEKTLTEEYAEKYRAITLQSLGLEINPNVFLPVTADVRPEQAAKDEQIAQDMATLLYDFVLPAFVRQVREGDIVPRDATTLVQHLHRLGINMRYLGRLTHLCFEQEREDTELFLQGKQRIHSMPHYLIDMLLVEMIARSVKHLVNQRFRQHSAFADAPAQSIASLLNHILSALQQPEVDEEEGAAGNGHNDNATAKKKRRSKNKKGTTTAANAVLSAESAASAAVETATAAPASSNNNNNNNNNSNNSSNNNNNKKKNNKKKSAGGASSSHDGTTDVSLFDTAAVMEPLVDVFASREDTLKELHALIQQRYLFDLAVFNDEAEEDAALPASKDAEELLAELGKRLLSKSNVRRRINPMSLLRRICQQVGIVIATRDYDLSVSSKTQSPSSSDSAAIVHASDILTLIPKVKSCEPEYYLSEFQDLLATSSALLQQGNGMAAFEAAQQALSVINQITGAAHEQALQAMDQLTAVFAATSDVKAAVTMASRTLAMSVQVQGLDAAETVQHHIQLALLEMELENVSQAFHHLLTAKYLILLVSSDRHPELVNIFYRLSLLYEKVGNYEGAMGCVSTARRLATDLSRNAMLGQAEAACAFRNHHFSEAVALQKQVFRLVRDLYGNEDERVELAKKNLEMYIRTSSNAAANPHSFHREEIESFDDSAPLKAVANNGKKHHKNNQKNKNKGKK